MSTPILHLILNELLDTRVSNLSAYEIVEQVVVDGAFLESSFGLCDGKITECSRVLSDHGEVPNKSNTPWDVLGQCWEAETCSERSSLH